MTDCYQNKCLLLLLPFLLFLSTCSMQAPEPVDKIEIVYEVFVQSFRDSNGDGIGDLQGLISKLDYIRDLGATAVWMMPVHPSPSYHKYDVTDYYSIHSDYGTMDDMDQLIAELHRRDMKLILDFVVNHTSSLHPWFIKSSSLNSNQYQDYYVWRDHTAVQDEINKKTTTFDSDNITQWHAARDDQQRYYGFFWKGMPDLNFDNQQVREEIYKIGKFWIEKGVDGFRLDAAKHIYPDDRLDDTRAYWEEFTSTMKSFKPDIKIIGEVWSDPQTLATMFKGLPSLFNFELTKSIPKLINDGDVQGFIHSYLSIQSAYEGSAHPVEDAILLSNHDMNRIRSTLQNDINKSKLAGSILLTLPGTVYIYYGEEIGMLGMKPDPNIREPFLWGDENFADTSWMQPVYSLNNAVDPLSVQMKIPGSIYQHYKKWIAFRKEHPVLSTGKLAFEKSDSNVLTYSITKENEKLLVIHNVGTSTANYSLPAKTKIISGDNEVNDGIIKLLPYTSMILKYE